MTIECIACAGTGRVGIFACETCRGTGTGTAAGLAARAARKAAADAAYIAMGAALIEEVAATEGEVAEAEEE